MTIDGVLKEFRELLSQYTGEAITGHYNGETQQKMESLFFQAEARGRESVVDMIEGMRETIESEWKRMVAYTWNSNHDYYCKEIKEGKECSHHIDYQKIEFNPTGDTLVKRPEYVYKNMGYQRALSDLLTKIKEKHGDNN